MIVKDSTSSQQMSNFWTGFTIGAAVLFFLGTKKGRKSLKDLMDYTENLEGNIDELINSTIDSSHDKKKVVEGATNITDLISRIQSVLPESKQVRKFFAKDGKTLKST